MDVRALYQQVCENLVTNESESLKSVLLLNQYAEAGGFIPSDCKPILLSLVKNNGPFMQSSDLYTAVSHFNFLYFCRCFEYLKLTQ